MRVQEVMSGSVRTVPANTPAERAWSLMKTDGIHHLVVTDGRRIVGVLSDKDAGGRSAAAAFRNGKTVEELMTKPVVTIAPDATVRRAANIMRGRTIGCLPVIRGNRLVGIVTTADLLTVVGGGAERPARADRRTLNYKTPHRGKHIATGMW
ncbi:MAG TPA: CBS domain-containing protein [Vicinamibacterales bacterium]|nr:CBS domain-containing protein [Vicinamibacterales bacterium]